MIKFENVEKFCLSIYFFPICECVLSVGTFWFKILQILGQHGQMGSSVSCFLVF